MVRERRRDPRHQTTCSFIGYPLAPARPPQKQSDPVEGRIVDISAGGLRVATRGTLDVSVPLRSEITFPGMPTAVPTLVEVCWSQRAGDQGFLVGLRFLL